MRIGGKEIIRDLICWILALVRSIKIGRPDIDSLENLMEIPLARASGAPAFQANGKQLARGPTRLSRRSDL
jgi:hypothetical protein